MVHHLTAYVSSSNDTSIEDSLTEMQTKIENLTLVPTTTKETVISLPAKTMQEMYLSFGQFKYSARDYFKAGSYYFDAIENNPQDPMARYWYGMCFYKIAKSNRCLSQHLKHAIECFDVAIDLKKNEPLFLYAKGKALCYLEKFQEARLCFEELLRIENKNPKYNFMQGNVFLQLALLEKERNSICSTEVKKKFTDAINYFQGAIIIAPNTSKYYFMEGRVSFELEYYELAINSFKKAIRIDNYKDSYYCMAAKAFFENNELNEALKYFESASYLNPQSSIYHFGQGRTLFRMSDFAGALKAFENALSLRDTEHADYHYYKGRALLELKKFAESIECFNQAIVLNRDEDCYYCLRGRAFRGLGKIAAAINDFKIGLRITKRPDYKQLYEEFLRELNAGL